MSRLIPKLVLVIAPLLALAGCQKADVGQSCTLTWGVELAVPRPEPVQLYESGGADFFESGNIECENLVCIVSPVQAGARYSSGGYCSKPCVSNEDCFESETGLVCRQMVLDPIFLEQLTRLEPALRERYLGDVQFSSYCAVPR
jgi:hypothetical protein